MKQKHMPRRPLTSTFKFLLVVAAMQLIACLYFFMHKEDITLLTLRPSLVPTAQYLVENPQPTPDDASITLLYNTYEDYPASSQLRPEICYSYLEDPASYDSSLSHIVVDSYRVPFRFGSYARSSNLSRPTGHMYCLDRSLLSTGLHLFELHLRRHQGDTPYVYQTALLIED